MKLNKVCVIPEVVPLKPWEQTMAELSVIGGILYNIAIMIIQHIFPWR